MLKYSPKNRLEVSLAWANHATEQVKMYKRVKKTAKNNAESNRAQEFLFQAIENEERLKKVYYSFLSTEGGIQNGREF